LGLTSFVGKRQYCFSRVAVSPRSLPPQKKKPRKGGGKRGKKQQNENSAAEVDNPDPKKKKQQANKRTNDDVVDKEDSDGEASPKLRRRVNTATAAVGPASTAASATAAPRSARAPIESDEDDLS